MKSRFPLLLAVALASGSAVADDARQDADYRIPVEDPALEPHALHEIRIKWKSLEPGARVMDYDLPDELDGLGQDIELTETEPNVFYGPKAKASCQDAEPFTCEVTYRELARDDAAAEALLAQRYKDADELAGRQTVSRAFRADPEPQGVIMATGSLEE